MVELLLDNKADIGWFYKRGATRVYKAGQNGHDVTVQCLLSNGANVYLCDKRGEPPFNTAGKKKSLCTPYWVKYITFLEKLFYIKLVKKDWIALCNSY